MCRNRSTSRDLKIKLESEKMCRRDHQIDHEIENQGQFDDDSDQDSEVDQQRQRLKNKNKTGKTEVSTYIGI